MAIGQKPYANVKVSLSVFGGSCFCTIRYSWCRCAVGRRVHFGSLCVVHLCRRVRKHSHVLSSGQNRHFGRLRPFGCCGRSARYEANRAVILLQLFSSYGCFVSPKRYSFRRPPKNLSRRLFCVGAISGCAIRFYREPTCRLVYVGYLVCRSGCRVAVRQIWWALRRLCRASFLSVSQPVDVPRDV